MAINLYRKGSTHTVRGFECEIVRCEISQMDDYLIAGCVKDPKELLATKKEATAAEKAHQLTLDNAAMDREIKGE